MSVLSIVLVALVAAIHLFIAWFEIFSWTNVGRKIFSQIPDDLFEKTKVLAANQGFYNALLAAGLIWSLFIRNEIWQQNVATCFLVFVAAAGIFGGFTASKKALRTQTIPALLGLLAIYLT